MAMLIVLPGILQYGWIPAELGRRQTRTDKPPLEGVVTSLIDDQN